MNAIARWTALAATSALVGCGGGGDGLDGGAIPTVPARGRVTLAAGKPLTDGIIRLEPLVDGGSSNQATGEIQPDGRFELRSGPDAPGAVPGKYRVLVEYSTARLKGRPGKEPQVEVREGQDLDIKLP